MTGDKILPEMNLINSKFKYNDWVPVTKVKERMQQYNRIFEVSLSKRNRQSMLSAWYSKFKFKRFTEKKLLCEKAFEIGKKQNLMNTKEVRANKLGATLTGTKIDPFQIMKINN